MKKKHIARRVLVFLTLGIMVAVVLQVVLPNDTNATQEATQETMHTGRYTDKSAPPIPCEDELLLNTMWGEVVTLLGRTIWGEAEGVQSKTEQAAVAWCILNRVDATGQTIAEVVTAPGQFYGYYRVKGEVPEEFLDLAADVLNRWNLEKQGAEDVGRVLPADYLYFTGDGERNHFRKEYQSTDYWGWTLKSPY